MPSPDEERFDSIATQLFARKRFNAKYFYTLIDLRATINENIYDNCSFPDINVSKFKFEFYLEILTKFRNSLPFTIIMVYLKSRNFVTLFSFFKIFRIQVAIKLTVF